MNIKRALRNISRFFFNRPAMNQEEYDEMIEEVSRPITEWRARHKAEVEALRPVRLEEIATLKATYGITPTVSPDLHGFTGESDTLQLDIMDYERWIRVAKSVRPEMVQANSPENNDYTLYSFQATPHLRLEILEDDQVGGATSEFIWTLQPERCGSGSKRNYKLHWPPESAPSN